MISQQQIALAIALKTQIFNYVTDFPIMRLWWTKVLTEYLMAAYAQRPATYVVAVQKLSFTGSVEYFAKWDGTTFTLELHDPRHTDIVWNGSKAKQAWVVGERTTLNSWETDGTLVVIGIDERRHRTCTVKETLPRYDAKKAVQYVC